MGGSTMNENLQDRHAAKSICFGCGPANEKGLRIKSRPDGEAVVAEWRAEPHHLAFEGSINGGILGTLLDCHSNWAAAHHLMKQGDLDHPPCTVTAEFHIKFFRPTPAAEPVCLRSRLVEISTDRARIETTIESGGRVTAEGGGLFVAVREGHPAYHRW
ncbi:MAG: PaaI family thioesterase [Candidatus Eisenbacteria bacterium]|nr:PaaI family thioesterase [Candidatus Latescibacterota bacterium]MBD3302196.1 PaaI family thioesterase [Candidatus Eisenbacteria bacterium]